MPGRWRRAWRALFHRDALSREMDAEIAAHLDFATAELVARGLPPAEARRQALLEFGSVDAVRGEAADQRPFSWVHDLGRDLRLSLRQLARSPLSALALTLTAALGICGLATVFSVVNAAWLRPLPYPDAQALEGVTAVAPSRIVSREMPAPEAAALRELVQPVGRVAEFTERTSRLAVAGATVSVRVTYVDSVLLSALRLAPRAGRLPSAEEYRNGAAVALLRDSLWQQLPVAHRRGDSARVEIDGRPYRVIGAFSDAMHFPERSEVWVPLGAEVEERSLLIRRDPGIPSDSLAAVLQHAQGDPRLAGWQLRATAIVDRGLKAPVAWAFSVVGLLALMLAGATAANVALQLQAVAQRRRHELATYAALGATTARLVRRLLADQVLVIIAAGVIGTLGAHLLLRYALTASSATPWPLWLQVGLDWRTASASLAFTLSMLAATAVLPAREGRRIDPIHAMREGGTLGITLRGVGRATERLLAVQVTLSVLLSGIATVLVVAYWEAYRAELHPADDQRFGVVLYGRESGLEFAARNAALLDSLAARVHADELGWTSRFTRLRLDDLRLPSRTTLRAVDARYLSVDGRRLVAGVGLTAPDGSVSVPDALVNESYARANGVAADAVIGRSLLRRDGSTAYRIVGVVADRGRTPLRARPLRPEATPEVFVPLTEHVSGRAELLVHARVPVDSLRQLVQAVVRHLAPAVELGRLDTITERHRLQRLPLMLALRLVSVTALLVLGISLVGLYGLVAQIAVTRRPEAGIRLALGASPWQVARQLALQGARGVRVGLLLGAGLAGAGALLLTLQLALPALLVFAALCAATAAVVAALLLATWLPLRELLRADPASLLRAV